MAKDNAHGGSESEFVKKIVNDPAHPPDVAFLTGYLGDSSEEGCLRIYLDLALSRYFEIPKDKVVHQQAVPNDPFGGQYVWVLRDAECVCKGRQQPDVKAKFFAGDIQRDFAAGGQAAAPGGFAPPTRPLACCIPTYPAGDCTFFSCPFPPSPGIACTLVPPQCPQPTRDFAQGVAVSMQCSPWFPDCEHPHTPDMPRHAIPTRQAYCTQVCSQLYMCPGGGGAVPMMAAGPYGVVSQVCTQFPAQCPPPVSRLCPQGAPAAPEAQFQAMGAGGMGIPQLPEGFPPTPVRPCPSLINCPTQLGPLCPDIHTQLIRCVRTFDLQCCHYHTVAQSALVQCPRTILDYACFPTHPIRCRTVIDPQCFPVTPPQVTPWQGY